MNYQFKMLSGKTYTFGIILSICGLVLIGCRTVNSSSSQIKIVGGKIAPHDKNTLGLFPAAIGISTTVGTCSGARIGENLYITAAHCFTDKFKNRNKNFDTIVASNSRSFSFSFKGEPKILEEADLALFAIKDVADKSDFDKYIKIGTVNYGAVNKGDPVTIVGFGCEEVSYLLNCEGSGTISKYMKYAETVIDVANYPGNPFNKRFFGLTAGGLREATDHIAKGDSGGAVYNSSNEIIGITHDIRRVAGSRVIWTGHTWLGHSDSKTFIEAGL